MGSRCTVFYVKQIWTERAHLCDENTGHSLTVGDNILSNQIEIYLVTLFWFTLVSTCCKKYLIEMVMIPCWICFESKFAKRLQRFQASGFLYSPQIPVFNQAPVLVLDYKWSHNPQFWNTVNLLLISIEPVMF